MSQYDEILNKLYNGEIRPKEDNLSEEYMQLQEANEKIAQKIFDNIDIDTKELLEKFVENKNALASIDARDQFIKGYKTGVELIIAGISKNK